MAFRHFLWGSHNFMVTALGSCVKWPSFHSQKESVFQCHFCHFLFSISLNNQWPMKTSSDMYRLLWMGVTNK